MDPPSTATTKKMKEKARKTAQKKAKKEKKKENTTASGPAQSDSSLATATAAATAAAASGSEVPQSYLSTFPASTTSGAPASTSTPFPAALLAEVSDDDPPGWQLSLDAAWAQGQKTVCIKWVRAKREKVAGAEEALGAGLGTKEEVEVSSLISAESIHAQPHSVYHG